MMTTVTWKDVALYLLSIEELKGNTDWENNCLDERTGERMLLDQINKLNSKSCGELRNLLEPLAIATNRAAECLYKDTGQFSWRNEMVRLDQLWMGPGSSGSEYCKIATSQYGGTPSPRDISMEIKNGRLNGYVSKPVPKYLKKIIVFQTRSQTDRFRIGDGYHRAVAVHFYDDECEILCYVGYIKTGWESNG